MLGIDAQQTLLGTYCINGKEKLVVACKDFTDYNTRLMAFGELKNTCIDSSEGGYGTSRYFFKTEYTEIRTGTLTIFT